MCNFKLFFNTVFSNCLVLKRILKTMQYFCSLYAAKRHCGLRYLLSATRYSLYRSYETADCCLNVLFPIRISCCIRKCENKLGVSVKRVPLCPCMLSLGNKISLIQLVIIVIYHIIYNFNFHHCWFYLNCEYLYLTF